MRSPKHATVAMLALALCGAIGASAQQGQPTTPTQTTIPTSLSPDKITDPIQKFDVLRVVVANEPNYSGEFPVTEGGTVTIPRAGELLVAGSTRAKAAAFVTARLKSAKLLKNPEVAVYIIARKPRVVSVNGRVQAQGLRQLRDGALLSDVLEDAIPLTDADLEKVEIRHEGVVKAVNYKLYRDGLDSSEANNPKIDDNDRVYVRARENTVGTVQIRGEIKDPNKSIIEVKTGSTVGLALQAAGGLTDFGDKQGIYVQRGDTRKPVPYDDITKGVAGADFELKDHDVIVVPKLERPKSFIVTGAVRSSQTMFPLNGKVTVYQAVAMAGPLDGYKKKEVEWSTIRDGKPIKKKVNFEKQDEALQEVQDGDIIYVSGPANKTRFNIGEVLGALSSGVFVWSQLKR